MWTPQKNSGKLLQEMKTHTEDELAPPSHKKRGNGEDTEPRGDTAVKSGQKNRKGVHVKARKT